MADKWAAAVFGSLRFSAHQRREAGIGRSRGTAEALRAPMPLSSHALLQSRAREAAMPPSWSFFGEPEPARAGEREAADSASEDDGKNAKTRDAGRADARNGGIPGSESDEEEEEEEEEADVEEEKGGGDGAALTAKAIRQLRRVRRINVKGTGLPPPVRSFEELESVYNVPHYLIENLRRPIPKGCGFAEPTPIQMQAMPVMLKRISMLGVAPTGSGKTAAYAVPLLALLDKPASEGVRALVLAPTKELVDQLYRQFMLISRGRKFRIFVLGKENAGGDGLATQKRDLVISTPMRAAHAAKTGGLDAANLRFVVLDEADRLFDLGFIEQVDEVLAACTHPDLTVSMFSATMFQGVESLARTVIKSGVRVSVGDRHAAASTITQDLIFAGRESGKLLALRRLVQEGALKPPVLIFVQSKERAEQLFHELVYDNLNVDVMHADRTPAQRERVVAKFRAGLIWFLICTDLMARGIDFKGVNCVINFDFPQSTISYIHRIGRTGRAGRPGRAITMFTEEDVEMLRNIAGVMAASGCVVPQWMLSLKPPSRSLQSRLLSSAPSRASISRETRDQRRADKHRAARRTARRRRRLSEADAAAAPAEAPAAKRARPAPAPAPAPE